MKKRQDTLALEIGNLAIETNGKRIQFVNVAKYLMNLHAKLKYKTHMY